MASISKDGKGWRIQYTDADGTRRTLRLGRADKKTAESVRCHVEHLLAVKALGTPIRQETAVWLAGIGRALRQRLERAGLASTKPAMPLGRFLTDYIANHQPAARPSTIANMAQAQRRLVEFFGADRDVASITSAEAEAWVAALARRYAPATVGRTIRRVRQFFRAAMRCKLATENPFDGIKAGTQANPARRCFVPREVIQRVIDAAPDAEWRLLIALSRYGGLRCPSEHLALRWQDVDWARSRFCVRSPKTGERWVPIFPELRPYLEECFEAAEDGAEHVITRYRSPRANLRTTFTKIIRRAGEKPWPKLFHNLRASRETELTAEYPIHVACQWIGNSVAIAARHYLTVREEDFHRAATGQGSGGVKSDASVA